MATDQKDKPQDDRVSISVKLPKALAKKVRIEAISEDVDVHEIGRRAFEDYFRGIGGGGGSEPAV